MRCRFFVRTRFAPASEENITFLRPTDFHPWYYYSFRLISARFKILFRIPTKKKKTKKTEKIKEKGMHVTYESPLRHTPILLLFKWARRVRPHLALKANTHGSHSQSTARCLDRWRGNYRTAANGLFYYFFNRIFYAIGIEVWSRTKNSPETE